MCYWIVVASADHAALGVAGGFAQSCHGKAGPIGRMRAGDGIIIYSPVTTFGSGERLQAFTAIGHVGAGLPFQIEMGPGFRPFRRAIGWMISSPAPIRPLLDELEFTRSKANWGQAFRYGQFEIGAADFERIASAMKAKS